MTELPTPKALEAAVLLALQTVDDPELPISVVDMGLVHAVGVQGSEVRVELLPTYTGCPALDVIRQRIRDRVLALPNVTRVDVVYRFEPHWAMDRMSERGRRQLKAHGMSVPRRAFAEPVVCPACGSTNTVLENPFGPTLCRAIYYCKDCRNPIERFKPPVDAVPATRA
jgi:ring-1,2-phenylacetyl-CoA epoxidase subunit PaaD